MISKRGLLKSKQQNCSTINLNTKNILSLSFPSQTHPDSIIISHDVREELYTYSVFTAKCTFTLIMSQWEKCPIKTVALLYAISSLSYDNAIQCLTKRQHELQSI